MKRAVAALAGPVTAAAVVLQPDFAEHLVQEGHLNDSKKLTKAKREALRIEIEAYALAWAVTHVSPEEIDRINILNASFAAMRRSVRALSVQPDFHADRWESVSNGRGPAGAYGCYVKGDARFASIAAASVLAKTHRDAYMLELHAAFPSVRLGCQCGLSHETTPLGHPGARNQLPTTGPRFVSCRSR